MTANSAVAANHLRKRRGGGGDLVELGGAGQGLAGDGSYLRRGGAVDGDENDSAGSGGVAAGVDDHVGDIAGGGLQRGVAEIGSGAVEIAEGAETGEGVGVGAVGRPEIRGENSLGAEDAEIVGLGDGAGDVIPAAAFVFGHGNFHAGKFGIDFGLQAAEQIDRRVAEFLVNPRIAVGEGVVEGGIPEVARALDDELDLGGGERGAGEVEAAGAVGIVFFGVPVEIVDVDQRLAEGGRGGADRGEIFVGEPVVARGRGA